MSERINPKNLVEIITAYAAFEAQGMVDEGSIPEDEQDRYHDVLAEQADDLIAVELRRAKAEAWRELVVRLAYFEGLDLNEHPNPYRNEATMTTREQVEAEAEAFVNELYPNARENASFLVEMFVAGRTATAGQVEAVARVLDGQNGNLFNEEALAEDALDAAGLLIGGEIEHG